MNKRFAILLVLISAAFFGMLVLTKKEATAPDGSNSGPATVTNHVLGQTKTGVTLTTYGDFQCPACLRFYPIIKEIEEKYKDRVAFQFRHYPLTEIHQNGLISSRAAEAAGLQNKFFEMHDALYENQQQWSSLTSPQTAFEEYAKQLGLDVNKFREDIKSEKVNRSVQADRAEAKKLGLSSTPSFLLNGKQVTDARDTVEFFSKLLDDELAAKKTTL